MASQRWRMEGICIHRKQNDRGVAAFASSTELCQSFLQAAYITHEEEVGIAVLGRPYTVDLMAMRQVRILSLLLSSIIMTIV